MKFLGKVLGQLIGVAIFMVIAFAIVGFILGRVDDVKEARSTVTTEHVVNGETIDVNLEELKRDVVTAWNSLTDKEKYDTWYWLEVEEKAIMMAELRPDEKEYYWSLTPFDDSGLLFLYLDGDSKVDIWDIYFYAGTSMRFWDMLDFEMQYGLYKAMTTIERGLLEVNLSNFEIQDLKNPPDWFQPTLTYNMIKNNPDIYFGIMSAMEYAIDFPRS